MSTDDQAKKLLLDLAKAGAPQPGSKEFDSWLDSAAGTAFQDRVKTVEALLGKQTSD